MKDIMNEEKHHNAKMYEWGHTTNWLQANKQKILKRLEDKKNIKYYFGNKDNVVNNLNQFFLNDEEEWVKFAKEIEDKNLLEIGGSCWGVSGFWTFVEERYHIDPLLGLICSYIDKNFNENWYSDVKKYNQNAEDFIPELEGKINGCIYMRNCLNHTMNPWKILDNISKYASKGCTLLLWGEITHRNGGDVGHADVCQDPDEIENFLKEKGFKIIRNVVHGGPAGVVPLWGKDYGCVAIKE